MTEHGIMQHEQSSPHQQGSLTPGVLRLIPFWMLPDEDEVAAVEEVLEPLVLLPLREMVC